MALTTHEDIRKEAGIQSHFVRESFVSEPDGGTTAFYVRSDDNVKFVPEFSTGATIAGVSDVQVYLGLSGVLGTSRMNISSIDINQGQVVLDTAPDNGASLTVTYSSSPMTDLDIEDIRLQAEGIVNNRLSICYSLPIVPTPSYIKGLATRMSAAFILIRYYGSASRDTASDGYALYNQLLGNNTGVINRGSDSEISNVGEIGLLCTPNYQIVDDTGTIIKRIDEGVGVNDAFISNGSVRGRLHNVGDEEFNYKDWQSNIEKRQPGSGRGRVQY